LGIVKLKMKKLMLRNIQSMAARRYGMRSTWTGMGIT